jgi:hypothetical protein
MGKGGGRPGPRACQPVERRCAVHKPDVAAADYVIDAYVRAVSFAAGCGTIHCRIIAKVSVVGYECYIAPPARFQLQGRLYACEPRSRYKYSLFWALTVHTYDYRTCFLYTASFSARIRRIIISTKKYHIKGVI